MPSDSDIVAICVKVIKTLGHLPSQSSKFCFLNLKNNLSDIRKELEKSKSRIIDNTLLFAKKVKKVSSASEYSGVVREHEEKSLLDKVEYRYSDVVCEYEEKMLLEQIIDKVVNDNSTDIFLYLKKNSIPDCNILNDKCKLDYGCTMSFDGIKRANKKAFTMENCVLKHNDSGIYKKDKLVFTSKEDWMKKTNLFVNTDNINVNSFVKYGLSVGISYFQNETFNEVVKSVYEYTEFEKASLNFNLKPTEEFIKAVNDAIKSENSSEEFKEIIKEYGQFIPTKVILGGRVYFENVRKVSGNSKSKTATANIKIADGNYSNTKKISKFYDFNHLKLLGGKHPDGENFDEKNWIESLKDYQNWECIEYRNPISIFQFLPDDLRKESFIKIGKKILYTGTEYCDYFLFEPGICRHFELNKLPSHISRIIQKSKDANCDILATAIDAGNSENIFFNCKIFYDQEGKPSVIIHGIQKEFQFHRRKYKLKVGLMIIGYDIDFSFILSDTSVELIKTEYDSLNQREFGSIKLPLEHDLMTKNIPFFGIPILSNLDSSNDSLVIGHNFCNTRLDVESKYRLDAFSYCSKTNCFVRLPKFTFCTLIIPNNPTSLTYELLPFEFQFPYISDILRNKPYIDLKEKFARQSNNLDPKCVSLVLTRDNNYTPIYLNQSRDHITIEYVECRCNKTCSICKEKTLKISSSNKDYASCSVFSLSDANLTETK
ncbi:uncharacterized protein OCT59_019036 [Rhizophagus irregularis]|nr:hypothetical protein OCT59_019036 [Rhizophagus irregularis]GET62543.1 hypothetical protein GLOIN_2v1874000 [Rhizophagus irregularis DAOM 181602=DAOM 197198]